MRLKLYNGKVVEKRNSGIFSLTLFVIFTIFVLIFLLSRKQIPEEQLLFDLVGMEPETIKSIDVIYQNSYDEQAEPYQLTASRSGDPFERMLRFLNQSVKKADLDMDVYQIDPITIHLTGDGEEQELTFLTTEGESAMESPIFLMWKGRPYQLCFSEESLRGLTYHEILPTDAFLFYLETYMGKAQNKESREALQLTTEGSYLIIPDIYRFHSYTLPFRPMETIIEESDDIWIATLSEMESYTPEGANIVDISQSTAKRIADRDLPGVKSRSVLTLEIQQVLKGDQEAGSTVQVDVSGGQTEEGRRPFWRLGISEKPLKEGESYVFFLQDYKPGEAMGLTDFYFGIMQLQEDHTLVPLFNLAPDRLPEYSVAIEELLARSKN